jgi:acetoin utilization protein AcuB
MLSETLISKVMTANPTTITPNDTVDSVSEIFDENSFHHIPVVDNQGVLQGIISKVDLMALSYGRSLFRVHNRTELNQTLYRTLLVKDVMTKDVNSLKPDDTVADAMDLFRHNIFHAIPIVRGGQLCGILSCYDLLLFAYEN